MIDEEHWLCPYCSKIGFRRDPAKEIQDQILDHLANDCQEWKEGNGKPQLAGTLKEQGERIGLKNRLQRQSSWRLFDSENRWYCPYCAHPTDVARPPGDKPTEETVDRVLGHLRSCDLAKKAGAKEIGTETLREAVQQTNRSRGLVALIRSSLEKSELWRQFESSGNWVCPYCVCVVEEVRTAEISLLLSVATPAIAQHLQNRCAIYQKSPDMNRSLDELKVIVKDINEGRRPRGTVKELEQSLATTRAQLESTTSELDRAREVQRSILPRKIPEIPGYEIACTYQPAAQLGGDFYGFIAVDENRLGFLIADVSGHGADAALIMSMTKKAFDLRGPKDLSPGHVLSAVHRDISPDLRGLHFVTAFYGILDSRQHTLIFSRAGHNFPLLFNPRRETSLVLLKSKGIAIGIGSDEVFESNLENCTLRVQPGDLLLIYTDGLVEAKNRNAQEFKLPRVSELVKRQANSPLDEMLRAILQAVTEYSEGLPQEDDIALMAIRYLGGEQKS